MNTHISDGQASNSIYKSIHYINKKFFRRIIRKSTNHRQVMDYTITLAKRDLDKYTKPYTQEKI